MRIKETQNNNPLTTRQQVADQLRLLVAALQKQFACGETGIHLGNTCAHYGSDVARMEGLSRALWGLFPLMANDEAPEGYDAFLTAIRHGTDPTHAGYWGSAGPYDQRLVEMAAYGFGLALLEDKLTRHFSPAELNNLFTWLSQIDDAQMPDSNWNYFAILVQMGFKRAGLPWRREAIERRFAMMEAYYLGNGWYSDGPGRPKDYYISMAFHFYGLLYAVLMEDVDPQRAATLRERAQLFAQDFIWFSAADGASVPFGRSLTYRFAMVAFWSAAAFAGLEAFSQGVMKGIILRHLRWWFQQPILDRDDILTLGYAYPNLAMCEDYNSPGSPYWALKTFLILALPEAHPFWQAAELPLPQAQGMRVIKAADQILVRNDSHVYLLTSGQLELNNYVNTEAKYTKFAYSSAFGFTIERGRYGLKHAACDAMLLLSEHDGYYRGRRACEEVITCDDHIFSRWSPWENVHISSWLIPCGDWHVRAHHIVSDRALTATEGGFAVLYHPSETTIEAQENVARINSAIGSSCIVDSSPQPRLAGHVITPPGSSIMFAQCAAIPHLTGDIKPGEQWLCCAVAASTGAPVDPALAPRIRLGDQTLHLSLPGREAEILIPGASRK